MNSTLTLNNKLSKLPIEVLYCIMSYSYNVQSKTLIEDIKGYHLLKKMVHSLYYEKWEQQGLITNYKELVDWLVNYFFIYSNNNIATMIRFDDKMYNIISRNYMLINKDKSFINKYISNIESKDANIQINIFWGLFTLDERMEIICNC